VKHGSTAQTWTSMVNQQFANWKIAIEIVDLITIKNGGFP